MLKKETDETSWEKEHTVICKYNIIIDIIH